MKNTQITHSHVTTATRTFSHTELVRLLAELVARDADMPPPHIPGAIHRDNGVTADVRFERITGLVNDQGYRAVVKITRDHEHVANAPKDVVPAAYDRIPG